MTALATKHDTIRRLQKEILSLHGGGDASNGQRIHTGLGPLEHAFPQRTFPTAAVHEFISGGPAAAAATSGFLAGLLHHLAAGSTGPCIWIGTHRVIYPPALEAFGLLPHRVVFIDVATERDALWTAEETLKCEGLAAVVCEASGLSFTQSRRLQLAVEESRVTGFIHRRNPRTEGTNACVSRWHISPLGSALQDNLPGVGHPRWRVNLQKIRNGRPGTWHLEWSGKGFQHVPLFTASVADAPPAKQKVA
jgi:protein ImuA